MIIYYLLLIIIFPFFLDTLIVCSIPHWTSKRHPETIKKYHFAQGLKVLLFTNENRHFIHLLTNRKTNPKRKKPFL